MSEEDRLLRSKISYEKRKAKILANKLWVVHLKRTLHCKICNLSFQDQPWLVDFHHRDPSTKSFAISKDDSYAKPKELVLQEIEKCDPLCANCHRTLHNKNRDIFSTSYPLIESPPTKKF
jgi:predicted HNH restriction endonuclease